MNKQERKAAEKIAQSAYARHLYEGLTWKGNYTLDEVIRYWANAVEDAGGLCPQLYGHDQNIFRLLDEYKYNVDRLLGAIAERTLANAANSAVENEIATSGMDTAPQAAYDNANIYADTFGIEPNALRAELIRQYAGHINPKT